jgi:Flp pilus assembly protein TadD
MTDAELHTAIHAAAREHSAGRLKEAEAAYRHILAARPDDVDALHLLGTLCAQTSRRDEGIALMTRACAINPNLAVIHANLGTALRSDGQLDRALSVYRRALELDPNSAGLHNNIGVALRLQGRPDEAIATHRKALELNANLADIWTNLGSARADRGQYAQALADSQRAVELDPQHERAHLNLAMLHLQLGDFERGWPEYEWRWKCGDLVKPRGCSQPLWNGGNLKGQTILLYAEQGFGDTLQFIRYVPMVAARGGRIILECQPILERLLQNFPGIAQFVSAGQPLPAFDVHCPLLSLPHQFATDISSIPASPRYIHADPQLAEHWRQKIDQASAGTFKVGLAWAGKPSHQNDRHRSMRLSQFALLATPGITFISLLKGAAAAEAAHPPAGMRLIDFGDQWRDFSETAAIVANLDLVISVDTSAAHLAGAMGKPVWTLLPFNADWRWLLNRNDSPWYPTMGLFRQMAPGNWDEVMGRVSQALARRIEDARGC